jgi:hypothetical protein
MLIEFRVFLEIPVNSFQRKQELLKDLTIPYHV